LHPRTQLVLIENVAKLELSQVKESILAQEGLPKGADGLAILGRVLMYCYRN
jgi:hypothetical protein